MSERVYKQIKRVALISTGTTPPTNIDDYYTSEDVDWYTPSDFSYETISTMPAEKKISNRFFSESAHNLYNSDSVAIVGIGATVGKVGFINHAFYANQQINILSFNREVLPKYAAYYLFTERDRITSTTPSVTLPILNQTRLGNLLINYPSLAVQQRIVSYLDAETAKIDHAIELLKKKREAYTRLKASVINRAVTRGLNPNVKLKDSGVEWIGMIPEGWEWHRLKDLGYMYSGLTGKSGDDFRSDDLSITKPYIPFTNVLNHIEIDPKQMNFVVMNEGEMQNRVYKGDLIFLMSSEDYESIAKSALVSEEIGEVYLNSFCRGYRFTKAEADAKFVNYELNSELYRNAIRYEARGFTRINIKVDRIETMLVILPPLSEQHAIASYLDTRCARIDKAVAIVDKQIDAYTRLKKSLINEVVTGKRRV